MEQRNEDLHALLVIPEATVRFVAVVYTTWIDVG